MRLFFVLLLAATCVSVSVFAQEHFQRECTVESEKVMVEVQKVPDLKQRCYEVTYLSQTGHLCVWARGTPGREYGYTMEFSRERVTEQGFEGSGSFGMTAEGGFNQLCATLVRNHRREQARQKFDPDAAAEQLDEFFKASRKA